MTRWLLWIAAVPLAAAALIAIVGALLPRNHVASRDALVAAPPDRVAALIRAVEQQPRWRRSVTSVDRVERSGNRTRYVEHSGGDAIAFDMVEEQSGRRFRSTIADPDLPFGGHWTIALAPEGAGTRVRIEERGFVGNVIFRFFATLVFGHEATMRAYLDDLQRAVSEAPSAPPA